MVQGEATALAMLVFSAKLGDDMSPKMGRMSWLLMEEEGTGAIQLKDGSFLCPGGTSLFVASNSCSRPRTERRSTGGIGPMALC